MTSHSLGSQPLPPLAPVHIVRTFTYQDFAAKMKLPAAQDLVRQLKALVKQVQNTPTDFSFTFEPPSQSTASLPTNNSASQPFPWFLTVPKPLDAKANRFNVPIDSSLLLSSYSMLLDSIDHPSLKETFSKLTSASLSYTSSSHTPLESVAATPSEEEISATAAEGGDEPSTLTQPSNTTHFIEPPFSPFLSTTPALANFLNSCLHPSNPLSSFLIPPPYSLTLNQSPIHNYPAFMNVFQPEQITKLLSNYADLLANLTRNVQLSRIQEKHPQHSLWKGCTDEEIENASESMEKFLTSKMFDRLFFNTLLPKDVQTQKAIDSQLARLHVWARPEHFELPFSCCPISFEDSLPEPKLPSGVAHISDDEEATLDYEASDYSEPDDEFSDDEIEELDPPTLGPNGTLDLLGNSSHNRNQSSTATPLFETSRADKEVDVSFPDDSAVPSQASTPIKAPMSTSLPSSIPLSLPPQTSSPPPATVLNHIPINEWDLPAEELRNMDKFKGPKDKIVCLMNCCHLIHKILKKAKRLDQEFSDKYYSVIANRRLRNKRRRFRHKSDDSFKLEDLSSPKPSAAASPSADDFVPALIFCLIRGLPRHCHLNNLFINNYRLDSKLSSGEAAYWLCQYSSCLQFIEKTDENSFTFDWGRRYSKSLHRRRVIHAEEMRSKRITSKRTNSSIPKTRLSDLSEFMSDSSSGVQISSIESPPLVSSAFANIEIPISLPAQPASDAVTAHSLYNFLMSVGSVQAQHTFLQLLKLNNFQIHIPPSVSPTPAPVAASTAASSSLTTSTSTEPIPPLASTTPVEPSHPPTCACVRCQALANFSCPIDFIGRDTSTVPLGEIPQLLAQYQELLATVREWQLAHHGADPSSLHALPSRVRGSMDDDGLSLSSSDQSSAQTTPYRSVQVSANAEGKPTGRSWSFLGFGRR